MSPSPDQLHRFVFEHANVRGELIHLDETYREVLSRRTYPDAVAHLLGEALAAAGLLSSILKFQGTLILQMQGKGPVTMAVASASHDQALRAVARHGDDDEVPEGPLHTQCADGSLAITIDPDGSDERYQGIVALDTDRLAEAVDGYFAQSEQLPTRVFLACDGQRAAGMLLQRLPGGSAADDDPDAWNRAQQLASTIREDELLDLDAEEVIRRLFHQEEIRLYPPQPLRFHCPCSRERIAAVLFSLGAEEAYSIIAEQGAIEAQCEFCGSSYEFDEMDVEELFASLDGGAPPSETLH